MWGWKQIKRSYGFKYTIKLGIYVGRDISKDYVGNSAYPRGKYPLVLHLVIPTNSRSAWAT